ncbi:hypothetical protein CEK25_011302 [Fusarium fujikuroi]|nr:hypothetical protein CEK25_011302 [Fusarium fujikuroi]
MFVSHALAIALLLPKNDCQRFPTTHPHLTTFLRRVASIFSLSTAPSPTNRLPIVAYNCSEDLPDSMTTASLTFLPGNAGAIPEVLAERWCDKRSPSHSYPAGAIPEQLVPFGARSDPDSSFRGVIAFDFPAEGRGVTHTIKHSRAVCDFDAGVGAKVLSHTDWLLAGCKNPGTPIGKLELCCKNPKGTPIPMFERGLRKDDPSKHSLWGGQ